ncbi:hypothetical protein DIPPA_27472 [Diplonema papillatum]|nr:hypothetical protein DIPPA_27472 [Diplonema papillatum]
MPGAPQPPIAAVSITTPWPIVLRCGNPIWKLECDDTLFVGYESPEEVAALVNGTRSLQPAPSEVTVWPVAAAHPWPPPLDEDLHARCLQPDPSLLGWHAQNFAAWAAHCRGRGVHDFTTGLLSYVKQMWEWGAPAPIPWQQQQQQQSETPPVSNSLVPASPVVSPDVSFSTRRAPPATATHPACTC